MVVLPFQNSYELHVNAEYKLRIYDDTAQGHDLKLTGC